MGITMNMTEEEFRSPSGFAGFAHVVRAVGERDDRVATDKPAKLEKLVYSAKMQLKLMATVVGGCGEAVEYSHAEISEFLWAMHELLNEAYEVVVERENL